MTDLLDRAHRALGDASLRAMFAARKEVFIDLLKWNLPVLAGKYEIDQFDDRDAEYLILMDAAGQHRASARLLRTDRPHLLGDLYPYLCAGVVPAGPATREITRFCLDRRQSAADRRSARNQLVTALVDHALREKITDFTGVAELGWFAQVLAFGWRCSPLGPAVHQSGRPLTALHIKIDDKSIDGLRRTGVYAPLTFVLAVEEIAS